MAKIKEVTSFEDFKVQIVSSESQADLLVWVTKIESEARGKDEIWCFVKYSEDKKVNFVNNFPDVKVFYVKSKSMAKWRKPHKLQKRIG